MRETITDPTSWKRQQASEKTVAARHAWIRRTNQKTGAGAAPGQLVIHVELGTPGQFIRRDETAASSACSYVRFAFETDEELVHSDDIVVISDSHDHHGLLRNLWCQRFDGVHGEDGEAHGAAETPECLVEEPAPELAGAALQRTAAGRYLAADGIEVVRHTNGRWAAYAPIDFMHDARLPRELNWQRTICSGQDTRAHTYRWINAWRAKLAAHIDQVHEQALIKNGRRRDALFFATDIDGWEINRGEQCFAYGPDDILGAQLWASKVLNPEDPAGLAWTEHHDHAGTWYAPHVRRLESLLSGTRDPETRDSKTPAETLAGRRRAHYLIETRVSGGRWDSEYGETPPYYRDSQASLDDLAETILVNIVMSKTRDPWRPIRVSTWMDGTPAVGHALRDSLRYSHL